MPFKKKGTIGSGFSVEPVLSIGSISRSVYYYFIFCSLNPIKGEGLYFPGSLGLVFYLLQCRKGSFVHQVMFVRIGLVVMNFSVLTPRDLGFQPLQL